MPVFDRGRYAGRRARRQRPTTGPSSARAATGRGWPRRPCRPTAAAPPRAPRPARATGGWSARRAAPGPGPGRPRTPAPAGAAGPRLSSPTGRCASRGCSSPSRAQRRRRLDSPVEHAAYTWRRGARRVGEDRVLRQVADPAGVHLHVARWRRRGGGGEAAGQRGEQRRLAGAVGAGDAARARPGGRRAARGRSRPGTTRSRTAYRARPDEGASTPEKRSGAGGLGTWSAEQLVEAPLGVAHPTADRARDVLALDVVDELVVVARRPVVRHPPGRGRRRARAAARSRPAARRRPPPSGGGPRPGRRGTTEYAPSPSRRPCTRARRRPSRGATGRGRAPGRRPGRGTRGRGWRPRRRPAGSRSTSSTYRTASSSRWLVGSSSSRQSGPADQQRREPEPGALAAGDRPDRSVARSTAASPSRAAASSARRVASQASWCDRPVEQRRRTRPPTPGSSSRRGQAPRAARPRRAAGRAPRRGPRRPASPAVRRGPAEVAEVGRSLHGAGVGRLEPGKETEQGRLAGAVLADEGEHAAGVGDDVDAVEDDAVGVRLREVARDERAGAWTWSWVRGHGRVRPDGGGHAAGRVASARGGGDGSALHDGDECAQRSDGGATGYRAAAVPWEAR